MADPKFHYDVSPLRWATRAADCKMLKLLVVSDADIMKEEKSLLKEADTAELKRFIRELVVEEKIKKGFSVLE